jgi:ABC-type dipeptide/oligopeptide/nickel transport system permease subunit/sugar lactone lactonase YvrE
LSADPLEQAKEAIQRGDRARARRVLVATLERQPKNARAWRLLARCVENESEAIFCLERVVKLDPGDGQARRALLRLHQSRDRALAGAPPQIDASATQPMRVPTMDQEVSQPKPSPARLEPRKPVKVDPALLKNGEGDLEIRPVKTLRNWPLAFGLALVGLVLLLAIAGPSMAPRDPLEEHNIFQIQGEWHIPPLNPFTPGYPFGTDNFGRDLYSRLLWAVRPTLVMVSIVALVRLTLGLLVGLLAGWLEGRPARALDALLQAALSVPVLLVALGAIAVVGVELGLWAFILGLSLTGWVETAQQVREQTRIVKGQSYVEAALALGASNRQILLHHVLKQISPMLAMLFAFEVSSTLMATAGLGFLGYHIGGDVWVMVEDFVSRRISGMPELGQMLATSWVTLTRPWAMVATGTLVFTTVLGFNLVGEGLRQGLNLNVRRRGVAARLSERAGLWFDESIWHPAAQVAARPAVRTGLALAALLIIFGAGGNQLLHLVERSREAGSTAASPVENPGLSSGTPAEPGSRPTTVASAHPTPGASPGTARASFEPATLWEFTDESGFDGGPALSPDGQALYAVSKEGTLYALSLEGQAIWRAELPAGGVGAPALDAGGSIYVADEDGGLTKLSPQGQSLWRFQTTSGDRAHSGPVLGPDGAAYYTVGTSSRGFIQAVSPDGQELWAVPAETSSFFQSPIVSATGEYVYLKEEILSAENGERVALESEYPVNRFFSGQDGKDYLLSGNNVIEWRRAGQAIEIVDIAQWDFSHLVDGTPNEVGVTADRQVWYLYTSEGGNTSLVWATMDDQVLGRSSYRFSLGKLLAWLPDHSVILCGNQSFLPANSECAALPLESDEPVWNLRMPGKGQVMGGFLYQETLYLTSSLGKILAVSAEQPEAITETVSPEGEPGDQTGLLWQYRFDQPVLGGALPEINPDGSAYAISEEGRLYALNPDGTLRYQLDLPTGLHAMDPAEPVYGLVWPFVLPDGTVLVISNQETVYAIGADGQVAWEQELEAPLAEHPTRSEDGVLYLVDEQAGLTAFDANGLRWRFQSQAANRPANAAVAGPDGRVYYTVTDLSRGFVQAVSQDGQGLWSSQAETGAIYEQLQVSPDGTLLFLKEDIFSAESGELLDIETPVRVDRYLMGWDGRTYLQSGHSVIQWQLGTGGFEVVQSTSWDHSHLGNFPPMILIDANQLYWVNYFETLLWISQDGRVLNSFGPVPLTHYDLENSRLTTCSHELESDLLVCDAYAPGEQGPVWQGQVGGVPNFDFGQARLIDGYLFVLGENQTLYKYWMGEPGG